MVFIVVASIATSLLTLALYLKWNKYALALAVPTVTTTFLVGVILNVMLFNNGAFANIKWMLIIAAVLFVVAFLLSGILTPVMAFASFIAVLALPFAALEWMNGVVAIAIVVVAVVLTWLCLPMLKTLVISILVSSNIGFGLSLLFLPSLVDIGTFFAMVGYKKILVTQGMDGSSLVGQALEAAGYNTSNPFITMELVGGIATIVVFVGIIFLAREQWSKSFKAIRTRFQKKSGEGINPV
jgi:hypothetical protein